jgi:hypothetical protein
LAKRAYVYDVETYRNYFCLSARSLTDDEIVQFVIDKDCNDAKKIIAFFKDIYAIGYNNKTFDDIVINFIYKHPNCKAIDLWKLAGDIIGSQKKDDFNFYKEFKPYLKNDNYTSIDLMRLLFSKKLRVGLKELECSLNHPNVEELPYDISIDLDDEQKAKVLSYNVNDIEATHRVYKSSIKDLQLRQWVLKNYNVDGYNLDGVNLGMKIFERIMVDIIGNDDFTKGRTHRKEIVVKDILVPCLKFETPEFQTVLDRYQNLVVDKSEAEEALSTDDDGDDIERVAKFKWEPVIFGHRFKFGIGGLHKDVLKGCWKTDETHRVVSVDGTSYYPNMIIKWGFKPAHLSDDFYKAYQQILDERVDAKRKGDKMKDGTLKLSINGYFGNMNNQYSWAYDLQAMASTTINGQLMLSMLCEKFLLQGFDLIDVNTDGVFIRYPRTKQAEYEAILKWWMETSRINLEETEFSRIYFLTTADYFGETIDPKTGKASFKDKGLFIEDVRLGKGMEFPILARAVKKYFIENIPIEETINKCVNILDFCSYKKLKRDFTCYWRGERQQRVNRFYASKAGAHLYKEKYNENKRRTERGHILKDSPVLLLNKFEDTSVNGRQINYPFYHSKARKMVFEIERKEVVVSLF